MRIDEALGSEAFPREERHQPPVDRRGSLARELLVHDRFGEGLKGTRQLFDVEAIGPGPLDQRRELGIGGAERADYSIGINHATMPLCLSRYRIGWDSNPRNGYPFTRSPGACLQPLGHLSTCNLASGNRKPASRTDGVGFEPTMPLRAYRFSRPAPSATRTPIPTTRRVDA